MTKVIKHKGVTIIYRKHHRNNASDVAFGLTTGSYGQKKGLVHLFEHCLFHGTTTKTHEECEEFRNRFAPSLHASTSFNYMTMHFYESSRDLAKILEFASDRFFNSYSTDEEFENEKRIIQNEINRAEQNNVRLLSNLAANQFYDDEINFYQSLGTVEILNKYTKKDLAKYRQKNYCRQNFLFSIVTNKSLRYVKKLVEQYFIPHLPDNPNFTRKCYVETSNKKDGSLKTILKSDTKLCTIRITKKSEVYNRELVARSNMVFSSIERPHGRIYNLFRKQHGLTYATPSLSCLRYDNCGQTYITIQVPAKDIKKAIDLTATLFDDLHKNGVTKEEFDMLEVLRKRASDVAVKGKLRGEASDTYSAYLLRGRLFLRREYRKYYKKETYESVKDYSKLLFTPSQLFVTILGNFEKKQIYTYAKMKKLFNIPSENK